MLLFIRVNNSRLSFSPRFWFRRLIKFRVIPSSGSPIKNRREKRGRSGVVPRSSRRAGSETVKFKRSRPFKNLARRVNLR